MNPIQKGIMWAFKPAMEFFNTKVATRSGGLTRLDWTIWKVLSIRFARKRSSHHHQEIAFS